MKIKHKKLFAFVVVLVICFAACAIYISDYYHADTEAVAAFAQDTSVDCRLLSDGVLLFQPEEAKAGFIFYPGGKVEYTAYAPLMQACAEREVLCVLIEMPFNLAVMDIDAANGIQEKFPEIENWYIGGHSLGGSMAASYLADNVGEYSGLILLGSYSTADLSGENIRALSIYGSEDAVMNREKYEENLCNLPADCSELVIEGGNHSGFAMYGEQEGDGEATIDNEEQISVCAQAIAEFIG